jgi:hypothetical protein
MLIRKLSEPLQNYQLKDDQNRVDLNFFGLVF